MFQLGNELLTALEKGRLPRDDENVKGIGWFLVCVGESLEKGSLLRARKARLDPNQGASHSTPNLAVAFCTIGDQIMDWSTGILLRERGDK